MKPFVYLRFSFFVLLALPLLPVKAQTPVIKVDLNQAGRQEAEVNEPGYTPWVIQSAIADSMTIAGVKVKFTKTGVNGTTLGTDWYKAGIQSPYFARLINDGITVKNGNAGGNIEMRISGLPAGTHSLLTYHNNVQSPVGNTFSPIDISLNGTLVVNNLIPGNRDTVNSAAKTNYLVFTAAAGQDVVVLFSAETSGTENVKNVILNAFEINTPNIHGQAKSPFPADRDEHVNADSNIVKMSWTKGDAAIKHEVYFGMDSAAVMNADHASPLYKGQITDTTFTVNALYSMNTYYWRVDELSSASVLTKGSVWYYRPRQLAFPDAGGYGRFARGGRGGKVVEVTNLNDDGPGSFRQAVTNDIGPRTIVFAVSGIINLQSRLTLTQPYITIAGQTAPGKGICIIKAPFGLSGAHDVVVQDLRVRIGKGTTYDGMGMSGSNHSIIDHCSISWTIDESFSSRSGQNISLQRTLISEALNVAGHQNYPAGTAHGYAASISGDIGSFHHNLLAHCSGRNWSLAGGLDGNGFYAGRMDIFNNVVYNWDNRTTDGGAHEVNFTNNYYKRGAAYGGMSYALNAQYDNFPGTQRYYFSGNVMPGVFDTTNQTAGRKYSGTPQGYSPWVTTSFFPSYAEQQNAIDAYKNVLSDVGCTQPVFDDHDRRIIQETRDSTYHYIGSVSGKKGLPDNEQDVGGLESYPEVHRATNWDSDHDGLPDWWETLVGTANNSAAGDFSDANADPDKDGFTNLDNYLMWMAAPHYIVDSGNTKDVNIKDYTRGYTRQPVYTLVSAVGGTATITDSTLHFSALKGGLDSVSFMVKDVTGSQMVRKIHFYFPAVSVEPQHVIVSFTGARTDNQHAQLQWNTIGERNTAYFELQRSGKDSFTTFSAINRQPGKGAAGVISGALNYSYTDTNTSTSITYYRLRRMLADSTSDYAAIISIAGADGAVVNTDPKITIGPNPADGKIGISLVNIDYPVVVAVFDAAGKTVVKKELSANGKFELNIPVPGVYVVNLLNKNTGKSVGTQKIVVR